MKNIFKESYLTVILLFISISGHSQTDNPLSSFRSIIEAKDSSILVTGSTRDKDNAPTIVFLRFIKDSILSQKIIDNHLFSKISKEPFGGSGASSIIETKKREVYIYGYIKGSGSVLVKLDKRDSIKWTKTLDVNIDDFGFGNYIIESNGDLVVIGSHADYEKRTDYPIILKLNKKGRIIRSKKLLPEASLFRNGRITNIIEREGYFYVFGYEGDPASFNKTVNDIKYGMVFYKLSNNFNIIWKKYFRPDSIKKEYVISAQLSLDGNLFIISDIYNNGRNYSNLVKLNPDGERIWEKEMNNNYKSSIISKDNNLYTIGNSGLTDRFPDLRVERYDLNGNLIWSKTFGTNGIDAGYSICETKGGTLLLAGYKDLPGTWYRNSKCWIIEIDNSGNMLWEKEW